MMTSLIVSLSALGSGFWEQLKQLDNSVILFVNSFCNNDFVDEFMITYTGMYIWIPLYLALIYMFFTVMPRKTAFLCLLGILVTFALTDFVSHTIIKSMVGRLRPANINNPISTQLELVNEYRGGGYSFPSSHACNTFGLTTFLFLTFRNKWLNTFMICWAVINCYTRMYLGVHYGSDILAGIILGIVCGTLVHLVFKKITHYQAPRHLRTLWVPLTVGLCLIGGILIRAAVLQFI